METELETRVSGRKVSPCIFSWEYMSQTKQTNKKRAWEWIALPRQGSWLHPSHHHAFCGLFLLQGSLALLQFHCLLNIIYWAPLGSDSMLGTGDANMKRLGGLCPQWDPSIVGETDMLIKSYKTILLKHLSVCGIMCIFMCLFIHSLSFTTIAQWTSLHSLLGL